MRRLVLVALLIPLISQPCAADPSGSEPQQPSALVTLYAGDTVVVRLEPRYFRLAPKVIARDAEARARPLGNGDIRLTFEANGSTSIAFSSELGGGGANAAAGSRHLYFHMFYYHGPNSDVVAYDQCPPLAPGGLQRVSLPDNVGKLIFDNIVLSAPGSAEC
jgi:hypothetical protein